MAVTSLHTDLSSVYQVGDAVRAKILSVTAGSNKVSLGLKPSLFSNDENENEGKEFRNHKLISATNYTNFYWYSFMKFVAMFLKIYLRNL